MIDHEFTIDGLRLERDRLLADNKALREALDVAESRITNILHFVRGHKIFTLTAACEAHGRTDDLRAALAKARHD